MCAVAVPKRRGRFSKQSGFCNNGNGSYVIIIFLAVMCDVDVPKRRGLPSKKSSFSNNGNGSYVIIVIYFFSCCVCC